MRTIQVELGPRSYDAVAGAGALSELPRMVGEMQQVTSAVVVADERVNELYGDRVAELLTPVVKVNRITISPGEMSKRLDVASDLLEAMATLKARRDDLLIALGGGVIGDLGGFTASIYQRGMRLGQIPTTLLAQVDASIGGKTGVNLPQGKNLAGTFYQPSFVIADTSLLTTLPDRELRSGMAEVIKYALCFEPDLIPAVTAGDPEDLVPRCIEIKASVVAEDETDRGRRMFLNYGHTLGHALEAAAGYEGILHGEAIAVGMQFAAELAVELGAADAKLVQTHAKLIEGAGLELRSPVPPEEALPLVEMDKKHQGGIRWVLLRELGDPFIASDVPDDKISAALRKLRARIPR